MMPKTNKKMSSVLVVIFKDKNLLSNALRNNLKGTSNAILELEYFYRKVMKVSIIKKKPHQNI